MSDFEEYYKSSEWFRTYESDLMMREAYIAGAQSQQAKIELLEKELTETQAFLNKQNHIKQAKIDELQARIDELERFAKSVSNWDDHPKDLELNKGSWGVRDFYRNYSDSVLKGNKDE